MASLSPARFAMGSLLPFLLAALAVFLGAVLDVVVKGLGAELSIATVLAWRYLIGGAIAFSVWRAFHKPWPSLRAIRFHAFRSVVTLVAAGAFFWGLTQLGLAEATVLGFTAALMVPPLAALILGERMTRLAMGAAGIGFAGAVLAVQGVDLDGGDAGNRPWGVAAVLLAAFAYALSMVLIRLRTRHEDSLTIVMFSNVMPGVFVWGLIACGLPFGAGAIVAAGGEYLPELGLVAILGLTVWTIYTKAISLAPAQQLAPFEYTALLWSSLFGYLFFDEVPRVVLYVGAGLIIAACLLAASETHFQSRRALRRNLSDPGGV